MAAPIRVGILEDTGPSSEVVFDLLQQTMRFAIDDVIQSGRLDRDVELVQVACSGLPEGTAFEVQRAFADLVAQGVLLIVGPAIGDNALVATPLTDQAGVPAINFAGTERARSEFMFHLQVGSHEEESVVLARHVATSGAKSVGIVFDHSPIGRRYAAFFEAECAALGLELTSRVSIPPLADDATNEVASVRASHPDAFVYLGLGLVAPAISRARADAGWEPMRLLNLTGVRGYDPDFAREIDGWVYLDMISDDNEVLASVDERLGETPAGLLGAVGYDLGLLVAEGLARAPEFTPAGVRDGLEQVKLVPAAEGRSGTTLTLGHWDHGALHGQYLVFRQWRDGVTYEI